MLSTFKCKVPLMPQVFHFSVFVSPSSFSANTNQNGDGKDRKREIHMKTVPLYESLGVKLNKALVNKTVWTAIRPMQWQHYQQPITLVVLLSGHIKLLHSNDNMITLMWPESRSAGTGPWWRKCNSAEEIRFRLLDPVAKLSSWRYTSVWTLIGSSCSGTVLETEHGWGKRRIIINRAWPFPNRCYP